MAGVSGSGSGYGPSDRDTRFYIWPQYGDYLPEKNGVASFMRRRFALRSSAPGHSWKYVTADVRTYYWDEFVGNYRWDEHYDQEVRDIWYNKCAAIYRRTLYTWRSSGPPASVEPAVWAAWTARWDSDQWKTSAAKYKANRQSEVAGEGTGMTKHVSGSRSFAVCANELRKELNSDPTSWQLFLKTHRRPDGSFVDERSRQIDAEMNRRLDDQFTALEDGGMPEPPTPEEINALYMELVGGVSHRRVYGIGSVAPTFFPEAMTPAQRGGCQSTQRGPMDDRIREATSRADAANARAEAATQSAHAANERADAAQTRADVAKMSADTNAQALYLANEKIEESNEKIKESNKKIEDSEKEIRSSKSRIRALERMVGGMMAAMKKGARRQSESQTGPRKSKTRGEEVQSSLVRSGKEKCIDEADDDDDDDGGDDDETEPLEDFSRFFY